MLQKRGLEGCARLLEASWAILASEVRLGRRLMSVSGLSRAVMEPFLGVYGELLGSFEVSGGLPGVILLAQSAIFRIKWISFVALHLECH